MTPSWPYLLTLAGIALLVAAWFAQRSWKYGVLRPMVSALAFAAAAYTGFHAYKNARIVLKGLRFDPEPTTTFAFGALAALVVFLLLRRIGHGLNERYLHPSTAPGRKLAGPAGALLSLIPTVVVLAILAEGLRLHSGVRELRHVQTCSALYAHGNNRPPDTPHVVRLRNTLEQFPQATGFLDRFGPPNPAARRNLAVLVVLSRNYDLFLKLNRSVAGDIYRHPRVVPLLEDRDLSRLIENTMWRRLLEHERIRETASLPGLERKLAAIDMTRLLELIVES